MPRQKDLKRIVRSRMEKTGESYTTARLHLLNKNNNKKETPAAAPSAKPDYASLAGTSDETLKAKTGCTWERWVDALDRWGAADRSHAEIAKHVFEKYKVPGWWAQTVTVGYERIRGLREKGQRRDGSYEANKSKTFAVPLARLYRAFSNARSRAKWLPVKIVVRAAQPHKSMRITWEDGTPVDLYFLGGPDGKSKVAIQHRKLTSKDDAVRLKQYWAERLNALGAYLQA